MLVTRRFGSEQQFLQKVNPDTQTFFGQHFEQAVTGDYPTLTDINAAYGEGFAADWLIPQLCSLSAHTGAKNLTQHQIDELSRIIATEYRHLKVTELLLFFYRFKCGRYGRFYGTVDPMVICCAIRDFLQERNDIITACEQQRRQEDKSELFTYEEWLEIKTITAMYNSEYTVP